MRHEGGWMPIAEEGDANPWIFTVAFPILIVGTALLVILAPLLLTVCSLGYWCVEADFPEPVNEVRAAPVVQLRATSQSRGL